MPDQYQIDGRDYILHAIAGLNAQLGIDSSEQERKAITDKIDVLEAAVAIVDAEMY